MTKSDMNQECVSYTHQSSATLIHHYELFTQYFTWLTNFYEHQFVYMNQKCETQNT